MQLVQGSIIIKHSYCSFGETREVSEFGTSETCCLFVFMPTYDVHCYQSKNVLFSCSLNYIALALLLVKSTTKVLGES